MTESTSSFAIQLLAATDVLDAQMAKTANTVTADSDGETAVAYCERPFLGKGEGSHKLAKAFISLATQLVEGVDRESL